MLQAKAMKTNTIKGLIANKQGTLKSTPTDRGQAYANTRYPTNKAFNNAGTRYEHEKSKEASTRRGNDKYEGAYGPPRAAAKRHTHLGYDQPKEATYASAAVAGGRQSVRVSPKADIKSTPVPKNALEAGKMKGVRTDIGDIGANAYESRHHHHHQHDQTTTVKTSNEKRRCHQQVQPPSMRHEDEHFTESENEHDTEAEDSNFLKLLSESIESTVSQILCGNMEGDFAKVSNKIANLVSGVKAIDANFQKLGSAVTKSVEKYGNESKRHFNYLLMKSGLNTLPVGPSYMPMQPVPPSQSIPTGMAQMPQGHQSPNYMAMKYEMDMQAMAAYMQMSPMSTMMSAPTSSGNASAAAHAIGDARFNQHTTQGQHQKTAKASKLGMKNNISPKVKQTLFMGNELNGKNQDSDSQSMSSKVPIAGTQDTLSYTTEIIDYQPNNEGTCYDGSAQEDVSNEEDTIDEEETFDEEETTDEDDTTDEEECHA